MSCILTCDELNGMGWEDILRSLIVLDDNGCMALRSTAEGGGGSYTFPSNHGNVAYVATGGNNGTGEAGNISKPFTTVQAAIAALDANNDGEVIILSSSSSQTIDDIDYSNGDCPEVLTIKDLCSCGIEFTGTINFAALFIETQGSVAINTDVNWVTGEYSHISCTQFYVPDSMVGTILVFSGCIDCDIFIIEDNVNAGIQLDVVQWKKSCAIGVIDSFNYNSINPLLWIGKVSQVDTDAPTVDVVIRNDLGETLVPSRFNQGEYRFTITSGLFKNLYTFIKPGQIDHDLFAQGGIICKGTTDASGNFIEVVTLDSFVAVADNALHATDLTIEVYPEKY